MHARKQILIVDDDTEITTLLADYLVRYGYAAHVANDGVEMFRQLGKHAIDLMVMDAMLPGADGISLVRDMRRHSRLPIIMLTARSSPYDRILGLESGADDYMGKPFEPRELVSRIQSVLRRSFVIQETPAAAVGNSVICFDDWELHCDNRCLYSPDGMVVALSEAEFRLMCTFLHNPHQLFQRGQLMKLAREGTTDTMGRSIDLLVSRLRQKLACMPDGQNMIKTIRGGGYMFNVRSVLDRTQSRLQKQIAGLSGH